MVSTRIPPPMAKVKIWMFWEIIGNSTIASTRTPPPFGESEDWMFGRFRKFYHCKYQNLMHTRCRCEDGAVAWGGHSFRYSSYHAGRITDQILRSALMSINSHVDLKMTLFSRNFKFWLPFLGKRGKT